MHVLFLTRKFPPQTGGMETFSWQLTHHWIGDNTVIARGRRQIDIFWVAPVLLYHAWRLRRSADLYHLGDAVLSPLAPLMKRFTGKPVVVTVHGLELTYEKAGKIYHRLIDWGMRGIDHFVCVSSFTAELLRTRGIDDKMISVIRHGVVAPSHFSSSSRRLLLASLGEKDAEALQQRLVLLTVGRLVKRKGVEWFIRNVLPKIKHLNPLYLVTSTGPEEQSVKKAITELHLRDSVRMLGRVDSKRLRQLYSDADIFVMPNISVPNDVEGFGFVAVEAAAHGLPVIAANLEGIPDAIHDKKNGMLFPAGDSQACADLIIHWHAHPEERHAFGRQARDYTLAHFRWEDVAKRYAEIFEHVTI